MQAATGFPLVVDGDVATTREPTDEELRLLREVLDPKVDPRQGGAELMRTALTELVGVEHPVVQTGMGWVAGPRLVAGTAEAGGLGILASATMTFDELVAADRRGAGPHRRSRSASTCAPTRPTPRTASTC